MHPYSIANLAMSRYLRPIKPDFRVLNFIKGQESQPSAAQTGVSIQADLPLSGSSVRLH